MTLDAWLVAAMACAVAYNAWMHIRSQRRERHMASVLREVHAMLIVWAEHWEDEAVRERLLDVLHRSGGSHDLTA